MIAQVAESATSKSRYLLLASISLLWILALVPGVQYLLNFEDTAGKQGVAPSDLLGNVLPTSDPHLPALVVALHPKCSCSDATLSELEDAAATFKRPYDAVLLIVPPHGGTFDWQQIRSYREAEQALHARVVLDPGGRLASSLGAFTSGDVLLYSAEDGRSRRSLLFAGGVTAARGMVGTNRGVEALEAAFNHPETNLRATAPVFGCGLSDKFSKGSK